MYKRYNLAALIIQRKLVFLTRRVSTTPNFFTLLYRMVWLPARCDILLGARPGFLGASFGVLRLCALTAHFYVSSTRAISYYHLLLRFHLHVHPSPFPASAMTAISAELLRYD